MCKIVILCLAVASASASAVGATERDGISADAAVARVVERANARARAGEPAAMIEADMRKQLRAAGVALEDAAEPPAWDAYGRAAAHRARQHSSGDTDQPSTTLIPR